MVVFSSFSFLFLLFFSQQEYVESFARSKSRLIWTNKNKANSFTRCFVQNIDISPVFTRKEKDCVKSAVETMMLSMSNVDSSNPGSNDSPLQTIKINFALSMAELIKEENGIKFEAVSLKMDSLSQTMELCHRTILGDVNKPYISEIKDLMRLFSWYATKELNSAAALNATAIPVTSPSSSLASSISSPESGSDSSSIAPSTTTSSSFTLTDFSTVISSTTRGSSFSVAGSSSASTTMFRVAYGVNKNRSVRKKRESITIGDEDIRKCADAAKTNFENEPVVFDSCYVIFNRGQWDDKADRTLDGDIRKLIRSIFDNKKENFEKVLIFIDKYVPNFVRERIVSYHTLMNQFDKSDFGLSINQPYFKQVETAVKDIKNMNGGQFSERYYMAKQIHKDMAENILETLTVNAQKESVSITDQDIQNCVNSSERNSENEYEVFLSCDKIFNRGVWDDKADRTLDGDIRKLIHLIYDGKRGNLIKVIYFIQKYVPKYVRELIVSYDALFTEFGNKDDFKKPTYQLYFQEIKNHLQNIKNMDGGLFPEKYSLAKQIHKDMLESMLENLKEVTQRESIKIENQDIQNCANSVKLNFENKYNVFASCYKIFNRGVSDEASDRTLDGDIRKLILLIYDGKRENLMKVLYFIDNYVPKNVRELIVSYDAIIHEFEKNEDFNLPVNQPYFQQIRASVKKIKDMNGKNPAENYSLTKPVYKGMLENIFNNLNIVSKKESITIVDQDLKNCASAVQQNYEDDSQVFVSCNKIFSRGIWDGKADKTLDGDIRKLMRYIYDGKNENMKKVLYFIDKHVPAYVRELAVSYDTIINEIIKHEDLNLPANQPYFMKIRNAVRNIKRMDGSSPAANYNLARPVHKDMVENSLENMNNLARKESITINEEDIEDCAVSVKFNSDDNSKVFVTCNKIFVRGVWDEKADRTLDGDIRKLMDLIYGGRREDLVKSINFIDKFVPRSARELIVSYDAVIREFEKNDDFNLPLNKAIFQQLDDAVIDIKNMNEKYDSVPQIYKDILENILRKFSAIRLNNEPTKGNAVQICIQAIREAMSNDEDLCNKIFKKEDNREWFPSDVSWLDSDLDYVVKEAYGGKRDNFERVLSFVRNKLPYLVQTAKGYTILLNEMEKKQRLSKSELIEFIKKVTESLNNSDESSDGKVALGDLLKDLNTRFGNLKAKIIQNCADSIQNDFTGEFTEAVKKCNQILKKDDNRDWVSDRDYYVEDVKKIVSQAYDGKLENLDTVLKFVRGNFPSSSQDILGYLTLLEELEKNDQLTVKNLNKILEKIKSSMAYSALPHDTKNEFRILRIRLEQIIKDIENKAFRIFAKAIEADYFTEEELKHWRTFYGGDNDFRADWMTYSYVEKLIIYIYNGKLINFDDALKATRSFYFADQRVEGYLSLLKEMEKVQLLQEEILKVFEKSVKEIVAEELSEEYRNRFRKLKDKLRNLIDFKKGNEEVAIRQCIEALQSKKWARAERKCHRLFLSKPNESFTRKDELDHVVTAIYANNLANTENVLKLVDIFPHPHQCLKGCSILLDEIEKKKSDELYFSALNQLKEKIQEIMYGYNYENFRPDHKERFKRLRENARELIWKFVAANKKYTAPKKSLKHLNQTIINIENMNLKIDIYYDLPPYFSKYPIDNELQKIYKEAKECATDYRDFVLSPGTQTADASINIWVFNDLDIFGQRLGFAVFSPKHNEFLDVTGMYLYRKRENEGRVQFFKHEFMHVLVFGLIGNSDFVQSVPRWFHDGLAELAQHGPCSTNRLNLMKKHIKDNSIQEKRKVFIDMISMSAEQQKKKYPDDQLLNYFLSYFSALYLRMRHPEFLLKILLETRERGWEGVSNEFTENAGEKVSDLFHNEKDTFFSWMDNSAENRSLCYSGQPDGKFKLTYTPNISTETDHESSFSGFSDGKFSWKNLIDVFNTEDSELIDNQIELYHATLKRQFEKLNLIPVNEDLKPQKSSMNTVLRFVSEIHSRREEISPGYYYYYADYFLKLVFEDIILPSYQRASLEKEKAFMLKGAVQLAFKEFLQNAFSKDQPPDHKLFLSWYSVRCREVDFCTPDDLDELGKRLDDTADIGDIEVSRFETNQLNEKHSRYQDNSEWVKENEANYKPLVSEEYNKGEWEAFSYILPIVGILGIALVVAVAYRNQIRHFRTHLTPNNETSAVKSTEVVIPLLTTPTAEAISQSSNELKLGVNSLLVKQQ